MGVYADTLGHLLAEMERIDLLLRSQVTRARSVIAKDEQFQGLYISEEELDRLLAKPIGVPSWVLAAGTYAPRTTDALARLDQEIADMVAASLERGAQLRLPRLAALYGLDAFDIDCLLICLAPELDLRYERIYAYLQDDVTKKRPSVDLILGLLSPSPREKLAGRHRFASAAPLLRYRLIELFEDPSQVRPPLLAQYLKIDDRVASYLLGSDAIDARIRPYTRLVKPIVSLEQLPLDVDVQNRLQSFVGARTEDEPVVLYLQGPYGTGKRSVGEALCQHTDRLLLQVDVEHLLASGDALFRTALDLLRREAVLQRGVLFFNGFDQLLIDGRKALLDEFLRSLEQQRGLLLLAGDVPWEPSDALRGTPFMRVELSRPPAWRRVELWSTALERDHDAESPFDVQGLATKFRFSGGQIRDAVDTARNLARWRNGAAQRIAMADIYEACRLHSNQRLRSLSRKIVPRYRWDDIVLPANRLEQLQDICNYVKYREQVFGKWGFDRKLTNGKGLSALFAGPSGTGKTMAAEIVAGELALELYKIDLSTVVSKFIGETEKNLSKIFAEAETSNAILFFDEADALFGKRSEVKDSHDRYANIEIGYLLQRIEEYEGVVVLATNFRKNMDEAFVRRLHFTVEFPFPNEADRRRIWEVIWPEEAPRDPGIDFEFLARRFEITGGNVRNIALASAFLAADDGQRVNMEHLLRATHRELQKMGKIVAEGEFDHAGMMARSSTGSVRTEANRARLNG
jgi:AAA+ superfamily predicted ATPase